MLDHLSIVNYRNIQGAELDLTPGFTCLVGPNGAGKTNILDAIYLLSYCKSYFGTPDTANIRHNQPFYVVQGRYTLSGGPTEVYCGCKRGIKKQFKRDKKEYQRLADHIGLLPLVIITPSDDALIGESPEARRRYADSVISQCDRGYLEALLSYNRTLTQRNALLKQLQEGRGEAVYLDVLDEQLARYADPITAGRRAFVQWLAPAVCDIYNTIAQADTKAEEINLRLLTAADRYELRNGLAEARERDIALGYTSRGPHKEDIEITLGGYPLKREGSQGQRKSFVLALKLAQYRYLAQATGTQPMLLLDDIFDKLDDQRGANLLRLVANDNIGQVVLTDTNSLRLQRILDSVQKPNVTYSVNQGSISSDSKRLKTND